MKLKHNIGTVLPQMYNDYLANTLYCLIWPKEWGGLHIAAPVDLGTT